MNSKSLFLTWCVLVCVACIYAIWTYNSSKVIIISIIVMFFGVSVPSLLINRNRKK